MPKNAARVALLGALKRNPSASGTELAEVSGLTTGTVHTTLARMQVLGWVIGNGRPRRWKITENGEKALAGLQALDEASPFR